MNPHIYRADIDGLRAIAVLSVIIFHIFPQNLTGGYIGVDIFFVISGYLITSIIYPEMGESKFSIIEFYNRRIRRIFPALFLVLSCTFIFTWHFFLPEEMKAYSKSLSGSASFVANVVFWRENSKYFSLSSIQEPLLHIWSLGVEEQFYIFFPILLSLTIKHLKEKILLIMSASIVLSLVLSTVCIYGLGKDVASFYLLPTRAWELLSGSLLAIWTLQRNQISFLERNKALIAPIALTAIIGALYFYGPNTKFPGPLAILPVFATVLLIYAGTPTEKHTPAKNLATRFLGLPPVVFIGKISYSLYLWHWPILVSASYLLITEPTTLDRFYILAASIIIAILTWRYIETPVRKIATPKNKLIPIYISLLVTAIFTTAGIGIAMNNGVPERFSKDIIQLSTPEKGLAQLKSIDDGEGGIFKELGTLSQSHLDFVIWGDSHANSISPAFHDASQKLGKKGVMIKKPGCFPTPMADLPQKPDCKDFNARQISWIKQHPEIKIYFVAVRWSAFPRWWTESGLSITDTTADLQKATIETVNLLTGLNKKVFLIAEVPNTSPYDPATTLAKNRIFKKSIDIRPRVDAYIDNNRKMLNFLEHVGKEYGVTIIYPHKIICHENICPVESNNQSLYFDDDHLSTYGSILLFSDYFKDILKK